MRSRVRFAGMFAVVVALAAGCGSGQPQPTTAAGSPSGDTRSATDAPPESDAKQDVEVTGCEQTVYTPRVALAVTNSTSTEYRYAVTVTISNNAGDATDAYFVEGRLGPGRTVTDTVPGANPVEGDLTCSVSEATRLPPQ
ncbi:hypothetical protein SAMN05421630_10939 [Prauserella marina]|uniref:Uncharacterized protein n=1 Tax=Prauserella marina TaxID=530584 RepID=A0A1G6V4M9_9PSEU|nr:hypothetical protein [Prauserella marina]PWV80164.1 hypothetical protein DES30_103254 [Prauserella marina]SDD48609.1 hypothetical protein SAMN05421630_10939 [Prauserella marina]